MSPLISQTDVQPGALWTWHAAWDRPNPNQCEADNRVGLWPNLDLDTDPEAGAAA